MSPRRGYDKIGLTAKGRRPAEISVEAESECACREKNGARKWRAPGSLARQNTIQYTATDPKQALPQSKNVVNGHETPQSDLSAMS
jgi:hypothetical protein